MAKKKEEWHSYEWQWEDGSFFTDCESKTKPKDPVVHTKGGDRTVVNGRWVRVRWVKVDDDAAAT